MYSVHVVVFSEEKLQASIDSATAEVNLEGKCCDWSSILEVCLEVDHALLT